MHCFTARTHPSVRTSSCTYTRATYTYTCTKSLSLYTQTCILDTQTHVYTAHKHLSLYTYKLYVLNIRSGSRMHLQRKGVKGEGRREHNIIGYVWRAKGLRGHSVAWQGKRRHCLSCPYTIMSRSEEALPPLPF